MNKISHPRLLVHSHICKFFVADSGISGNKCAAHVSVLLNAQCKQRVIDECDEHTSCFGVNRGG